jgi:hypothetical protein
MSEYRIEKLRRQVSVWLLDGSRLEGEMFLKPVGRHRSRPEDPSELLNDVEPYFPLVRDGKAFLISKSSVVLIETFYEDQGDPDFASLGVAVEVTMADGNTCRGSIFVELRAGRQRLFDHLNAFPSRFLPVVDAQKVYLVNTQTIAHVREVD